MPSRLSESGNWKMMGHWVNTQSAALNRDHLHAIIKHFRDVFPDNFAKCGMKLCKTCEGTGIPVQRGEHIDLTFWQPGHYCDKCNGFGVTGIKRIYDEYICKTCGGAGCEKCKLRGTMDWISNVVKG